MKRILNIQICVLRFLAALSRDLLLDRRVLGTRCGEEGSGEPLETARRSMMVGSHGAVHNALNGSTHMLWLRISICLERVGAATQVTLVSGRCGARGRFPLACRVT